MQNNDEPLPPGTVLEGFQLRRCLGHGGFGEVYEAVDQQVERSCAFKILRPRPNGDWQSLINEARLLAQLKNKNIVHVYQAGALEDGRAYIAMENFGEGLNKISEGRPWSLKDAIEVMRQVLSALASAHQAHIVHCDIKEANILFDRRTHQTRLCDFGVARSADQINDNRLRGSAYYISPERYAHHLDDPRSDLFSLGVVFYRMCTGGLYPFARPPRGAPKEWWDHVKIEPIPAEFAIPEPLARWCYSMMAFDPALRPQSAQEAWQALKLAAKKAFRPNLAFEKHSVLLGAASFLLCAGVVFGGMCWVKQKSEADFKELISENVNKINMLVKVVQLTTPPTDPVPPTPQLSEPAVEPSLATHLEPAAQKAPAAEKAPRQESAKKTPSRPRAKDGWGRRPTRSTQTSPFVLPEGN